LFWLSWIPDQVGDDNEKSILNSNNLNNFVTGLVADGDFQAALGNFQVFSQNLQHLFIGFAFLAILSFIFNNLLNNCL